MGFVPIIPKPAISVIAGVMFGVAWLLLIDGHVYANHFGDVKIEFWYYTPGIVATVALLMANIVTLEELNANSFFDDSISNRLRAWLLTSFFLSFGAIAAAVWLTVAKLAAPHVNEQWPGIALILQSVFLFVSSLSFVYSKSGDDEEYSTL